MQSNESNAENSIFPKASSSLPLRAIDHGDLDSEYTDLDLLGELEDPLHEVATSRYVRPTLSPSL